MFRYSLITLTLFSFLLLSSCSEDEKSDTPDLLETPVISAGEKVLSLTDPSLNGGIVLTDPLKIQFLEEVDILSVNSCNCINLRHSNGDELTFTLLVDNNNTMIVIQSDELISNQTYFLEINDELKSASGKKFKGAVVQFTTGVATIIVTSLKIGGNEHISTNLVKDTPQQLSIEVMFSYPIDPSTVSSSSVRVTKNSTTTPLTFSFADENRKLIITSTQTLVHLSRYQLNIQASVKGAQNEPVTAFNKTFYTVLDPTPKMPLLANDEDSDNDNTNDLLSVVQKQTFKYFYDFAHPTSGMAYERNASTSNGGTVTSGGSGFGIMALIVGMERNFITQQEGLDRMHKIVTFLEGVDKFHGAWSHWINGNTGDVIPFSANDNGGDLVETAFMVEGLITFRQYLTTEAIPDSYDLVNRINVLWQGVEWDWYRKSNENVLYWHWSPNLDWVMNHQIRGWNEALIIYTLAAASPTHTIPPVVYTNGWARNGAMQNGNIYEGIQLPLGPAYGGPLFFTHYSFLGMNPTNLNDQYADYWTQNVNHSLINYRYCVRNPKNFVGYSEECWGLTASDNHQGYSAHSPTNDLGVITPTAALSSFPYTPTESMRALKFFYYTMGDRLWGEYGFYDAFNITEGWTANSYLAIDQGPIVVMIENYRTGLLWNLFMSAPEVQAGLDNLGFTY
jgi:hypothetical protein